MTLRTLWQYLFTGSPEAIRVIAVSRGTVPIGLALVASAALAREYDGEYLPGKPWVLLIPFAAALGLSALLYLPTHWIVRRDTSDPRPRFGAGYRAFLGLFLATAPLAWLYAIPYERFLSALAATEANLWTLAAVSLWRVLLIAQVVRVFTGRHYFACLCAVMLVADVVVLAALAYLPLPVFDLMGGLRQSERERLIAGLTFLARLIGCGSLIVWILGGFYWLFIAAGEPLRLEDVKGAGPSRGLVALAVGSVVMWATVLPFTQREQRRGYEVERLFAQGKYDAALAEMSRRAPGEYPPQWDPPPRVGRRGSRDEELLDVMEALAAGGAAPWVVEVYGEKFARSLRPRFRARMDENEPGRAARLERLLARMPHGREWDEARKAVAGVLNPVSRPTTSTRANTPTPPSR